MGQQYSYPQEGAKFQVIGAGLPRTGTASFSQALSILLKGPVYHGGTQFTLGPEIEIKTWIKLFSQWPPQDDAANRANLDLIKSRTAGFVAMTDVPGCCFLPELMALYPDAKVICTVRDVEAWENSMKILTNAATPWFLRFVLFPVPTMRYIVDFVDGIRRVWLHQYGETEPPTSKSFNGHIAWLKENVPPDRLVFFDVKDGWEPLCQALDVPIPKDVPFPRINDSKALEAFAKKEITRGLAIWAGILAVGGVTVAIAMKRWM